jgi:hypothetical protein
MAHTARAAQVRIRGRDITSSSQDTVHDDYTDIGITKLNGTGNRTVEALLRLAASRQAMVLTIT